VYELEEDLDGDGEQDAVKDLRTGLMWQRRPDVLNRNAVGDPFFDLAQAQARADSMLLEGFSDWRLPTMGELISILDYSRVAEDPENTNAVAVPEIFRWLEDPEVQQWSITHVWSTTDYTVDFGGTRQWRINPFLAHTGHSFDTDDEEGFAAVRTIPRTLPPGVAQGDEAPANRQLTLGDFDASGDLDLTDAIATLNFLFLQGPPSRVFTVRPTVSLSIDPARFVADSPVAGMVEDTFTGLFWMRAPLNFRDEMGNINVDGDVHWRDALINAEDHFVEVDPTLILDDWRLPNVFELATLTDYAATSTPAMASVFDAVANENCPFIGEVLAACKLPYWSSTTAHPERAYQFYPNSAVEPSIGGVAAGAVRCDSVSTLGEKLSDGWVFPVRGPDP
jgi:hypothetical protein